ncbi:hypothetical protein SAMN05421856_106177 [Chryseobacterium taichungense]|uniref:Dolichyl-phosphate-mannose-protein mannosyltransferase n=1 Tax=Chryseobacterium taichungense TaxID=295069 RepID=A0A1H8B0T6_9FLAO|nr:hypothetical protein [Chryseobacterium taichungense]SEM76393.1 hypothetical protein SAMN05421856_106177 [Chryseobacterium taichungense]
MKSKWRISFSFIVVIIAALSFWNYNNRIYDWDMPGYIGCLYTLKYPDSPDKIRRLTYEEIRKKAPEYEFKDILGTLKPANKARQAFAYNTKAFMEQLPYYDIKVGYNFGILILYELGFSSPDSVTFLSIISYFISGLLLFIIFKIIFPENYILAIVLTVGIMLLPPMTNMSRVATPDMFVLQFLLVFMIGLLKKWNKWIVFSVLLAITISRPDYVTLTLSYLAVAGVYGYIQQKKVDFALVFQGIILLALYVTIIKICHYPGWKHLFYDTFIQRREFVSGTLPNFSVNEYLRIIYHKIIYFKKITVTAFALFGLIFYFSKDSWVRTLAIFVLANIYIRFVFFPHSSELRFFFGYIVLLIVIFLYALSKKYNGFKLRKIA